MIIALQLIGNTNSALRNFCNTFAIGMFYQKC